MLRLQLDTNVILDAVKQTVTQFGMPTEGKQIVARLIIVKGEVTGAEVGIAGENEDVSSFFPAPKAPVKRGGRKPKAVAAV